MTKADVNHAVPQPGLGDAPVGARQQGYFAPVPISYMPCPNRVWVMHQ
ncbi:hypothetical protein [Microseira wollei]|nr:hypothetical protein [Microseira wollei]